MFEDSEVKKAATEKAEAVLKPSAIFASNTSTIPITALAKNSARPKNFIGIHFFSPVDKMMLVEIILGKKTGDKALATAIDYRARHQEDADRRQRHARLLRQPLRAALHVGSLQDADRGRAGGDDRECRAAAGMPVGPLALTDETAVDLAQKIMKQTIRDLGDKAVDPEQMELIDTLVDTHRPLRPQERQGLLRLSGKARQEEAVAGPEGPLSAAEGRTRSISRS